MRAPTFSATLEDMYSRLPHAFQEADAAQPFPEALPDLDDVLNQVWNPRPVGTPSDTWDKIGSANCSTPALDDTDGPSSEFNTSVRVTTTSAGTFGLCPEINVEMDIGNIVRWAIWVWVGEDVTVTPELQRNSPLTDVTGGSSVSVPANTWTEISGTFTITSGESGSGVYRIGWLADSISSGVVVKAAKAIVTIDQPFTDYFDGDFDSTAYGQDAYVWMGAPNNSMSAQIPTEGVLAGYPMKRWLAGVTDQAGSVETLLDRFQFDTPDDGGSPNETSDLGDPMTADAAWLPWLAQILGVKFPPSFAEQQIRDAIASPEASYLGGTESSIEQVVRQVLTDSQYVSVYNHTTDSSAIGAGGQWDVCIVTKGSENPDSVDLPQLVIDAGLKPAGVVLWARTFETPWSTIQTTFPAWSDWNGNTWQTIEESGLA